MLGLMLDVMFKFMVFYVVVCFNIKNVINKEEKLIGFFLNKRRL